MITNERRKEFFWGIDALRLVAMVGVVVLHTLGRSGLLQSGDTSQFRTAWFLEALAYYAVDAFCIISGFVQYSDNPKPIKISRIISLWITVFFYGLAVTICFLIFSDVKVGAREFLTAVLPLTRGEYWFFSSYVGMFLFSPIINEAVRRMKDRTLFILGGLLLALTTVELFAVRLGTDALPLVLDKGYSSIWFCVMYFVGAVTKKTRIYDRLNAKKISCLAIALCLVCISWVWKIFIGDALSEQIPIGKNWDRLLLEYISPTIVSVAFLMVVVFANIRIGKAGQRVLKCITPSVFSIYLLNSHPLIAHNLYDETHLQVLNNLNGGILVVTVLGISIAYSVACIIIDIVRAGLFKICKFDETIKRIDDVINL